MRRYRGLRRSNIVDRIEHALREGGAQILSRANPTTAPFEFTVKTPRGVQRELVCYAFTANGTAELEGSTGTVSRSRTKVAPIDGTDSISTLAGNRLR